MVVLAWLLSPKLARQFAKIDLIAGLNFGVAGGGSVAIRQEFCHSDQIGNS
jgi:hypothetical protein